MRGVFKRTNNRQTIIVVTDKADNSTGDRGVDREIHFRHIGCGYPLTSYSL